MPDETLLARVYIVRHGETAENREGIIQGQANTKLNELGVKQAALVAKALKNVRFDIALSSDLSRAADTAEAILQHHQGVELNKQVELRERSLGSMEGKKHAPGVGFKFTLAANESVEASSAFSKRITGWWNRVILQSILSKSREDGEHLNVLVATHGGVIVGLVQELLGSRKVRCQKGVVVWKCMNASVTIIEVYGNRKGVLVQYSDITHLEGLEVLESSADQTQAGT
ncbi:histidine phosphatase superfamily [Crepidotus variabilis]|uniref:Histidine phosphatase superfamily n=1 Tax=Crepidotus variabilis TaxID=179855 RepID=A0A9P6JSN3_9AGAR|nr:histidine phosphatase superfamily [Crepidotus variabilis]